jgi:phosphate starvation-inducible PhoH-like protein
MGIGSRIIVTGDVTQVDLPPQTRSGLMDATQRLRNIHGVAVVELNARDIVRHRLVQDIVGAYDNEPKRR